MALPPTPNTTTSLSHPLHLWLTILCDVDTVYVDHRSDEFKEPLTSALKLAVADFLKGAEAVNSILKSSPLRDILKRPREVVEVEGVSTRPSRPRRSIAEPVEIAASETASTDTATATAATAATATATADTRSLDPLLDTDIESDDEVGSVVPPRPRKGRGRPPSSTSEVLPPLAKRGKGRPHGTTADTGMPPYAFPIPKSYPTCSHMPHLHIATGATVKQREGTMQGC